MDSNPSPREEAASVPPQEKRHSPDPRQRPFPGFFSRLAEGDLAFRTLAGAIAVTVGIALTSVTIGLTQRAAGLLRGQDPFFQAYEIDSTTTTVSKSYQFPPTVPRLSFTPGLSSPVVGGPIYPAVSQPPPSPIAFPSPSAPSANTKMKKLLASTITIAGIAASIPVFLAWLSLIRLSGHACRIFAERVLEWPIERGSSLQSDDESGVVVQFQRWFQALAVAFMAILAVGLVEQVVMITLIVSEGAADHTPPLAPAPTAPYYAPMAPYSPAKPVDEAPPAPTPEAP